MADRELDVEVLLAQLRVAGERPEPLLLDAIRRLGNEAVPTLVAMVTNPAEYEYAEDDEAGVTGWAPYSAIKILGELHPPEALEPLLSLLSWDDYDFLGPPLEEALGHYGETALEPLKSVLSDPTLTIWTRISAMGALRDVGKQHPSLRDEVVRTLAAYLESEDPGGEDPETFHGFVISRLVDLEAQEAVPAMMRSFKSGTADPFIIDWNDVATVLEVPPEDIAELEAMYDAPALDAGDIDPAFKEEWDRAAAFVDSAAPWAGLEPYRRPFPKVGRNEPCPCGSGKKYKRCHGRG